MKIKKRTVNMKKKNYTAIANIVIIILIVVVFAGIQFN